MATHLQQDLYINLACIDRHMIRGRSKEYERVTMAMVRYGDVDAINETKGPIEFSEIARNISLTPASNHNKSRRRLILVEGAPGVGKSTFAWEYCRRWERGDIAQQYQLVLLIRLRDNGNGKAKTLKDLIHHPLEGVAEAVCRELVSSHELHVMIILEGFDELPGICRKDQSLFTSYLAQYYL